MGVSFVSNVLIADLADHKLFLTINPWEGRF